MHVTSRRTDHTFFPNKLKLEIKDDTAHEIMGGLWHIPSSDQFNELIENTNQIWVKYFKKSGVNGCIFQSKINKKSIFFPAAGNMDTAY